MEREKRFAIVLSVGIGIILLFCTIAAQFIYWRLLPQVQVVEGEWIEAGFVLPKEALYTGSQGTCVYYIEEKTDRFQTKYIVKEILVTVTAEDSEKGTVTVLGIYNPDWKYAANASYSLQNGMEVKVLFTD